MSHQHGTVPAAQTMMRPRPPKGFIPSTASEAELVKYGIPPRPDEKSKPFLAAKWDRELSRPIQVVPPTAIVEPRKARPGHVLASGPIQVGDVAGAIVAPEAHLLNITGSWTIPNVYPPPGAGDGEYYLDVLVGIDAGGWLDTGFLPAADGLCAGTTSKIVVSGGGRIIQQSATVWYSYRDETTGVMPFTPNTWTSLAVKPGDTVSITVCTPMPGQGWCSARNVSSGEVVLAEPVVHIAGTQAGWWVGTVTDFLNYTPTPEFGVIFIYDALAGTNSSDLNLNSAKLLDLNPDAPGGKPPVAQATQVSPQVLEISAYNNQQ